MCKRVRNKLRHGAQHGANMLLISENCTCKQSLCVDACCAKSMFIEFEIFLIHGFVCWKAHTTSNEASAKKNTFWRQRYHNSPFMLAYMLLTSQWVQDLPCWCYVANLLHSLSLPLWSRMVLNIGGANGKL